MIKRMSWSLVSIIAAITLSGCGLARLPLEIEPSRWIVNRVSTGPAQRLTYRVPPEDAGTAVVTVEFGDGTIDVSPGSGDLLDAEFVYNVDDLEPEISYQVTDGRGELWVGQETGDIGWDLSAPLRNEWRLQLGTGIPLDARFSLGATTGELELGGLRLTGLQLKAGAADMTVRFSEPNLERLETLEIQSGAARLDLVELGNAHFEELVFDGGLGLYTLDFGGEWTQSAQVNIQAGASEVVLRVPVDIGVRVCPGDLRQGDYGTLRPDGACYANELVGTDRPQLQIDVDLGLGQLEVKNVRGK
jgi:hypothetical protein